MCLGKEMFEYWVLVTFLLGHFSDLLMVLVGCPHMPCTVVGSSVHLMRGEGLVGREGFLVIAVRKGF